MPDRNIKGYEEIWGKIPNVSVIYNLFPSFTDRKVQTVFKAANIYPAGREMQYIEHSSSTPSSRQHDTSYIKLVSFSLHVQNTLISRSLPDAF